MRNKDEYKKWLEEDSKYIKVKVGQSYKGILKGMEFDRTGGYQGKPAVKYSIESLEDGKVRELSSGSKALSNGMSKFQEGDVILITAFLDDKEQKSYKVSAGDGVATPAPAPVEDKDLPF